MRLALRIVLIVLPGVGLLVAVPAMRPLICTRASKARADIVVLEAALEVYRNRFGRLPATQEGIHELVRSGVIDRGAQLDPWGYPYRYAAPSPDGRSAYDVWSYGADDAPGGVDYNDDLHSQKEPDE